MKMIFPRYRDASEDESENVIEQQKLKLLTIKNNIKMKQNEIKKYTVKVSNNETEANFDFNKIEIAKAAASLFVLDDKYHTVMLVDNETNKGIHFDPMTDLTQEQRDKIKELNNNNMKTNETMTVNGTVENEVLTINTNEDKFLYDYRETRNNKREFYGFKNNFFENHRWLVAAYCDEVTLEEFVAKVKEIANTEKQYTCHGFNPNLFGMPNIGKYTVIVVKGKDTIEDSYDDLYIAKTKAIEYLYDDTCEYVSLIDNSTNKGLHFEPYNYAVISEDKYTGKTIIGFNELEAAKNMAQVCMAHKWNKNTKIVDAKMNLVNTNK